MVYLIGASGHAKVIIEILEELNVKIQALKDDNPTITSLVGYDVYREFPAIFNKEIDKIIISIGNNSIRKRIATSNDYNFMTAVHPSSNISVRCSLGAGTVVMAGATINSSVRVGKHAIINTNCSIDHDCVIEDYVHISPNAAIAGIVKIGEGTHIGIGASVIQCINIGKWCTIGAGAVVIRDIPDGCTVVGNPGKVIKTITV